MGEIKIKSPVFIIGNPRSGTSLLRLLLTCHPNMIVPPESAFLVWWYDKYKNWTQASNEDKSKLSDFIIDLFSSKKIEFWKMDKEKLTEHILKYQPNNYAELMSCIYESYAEMLEKDIQIWGDKNNYYLNKIDTLQEIYPLAKFIHIIRDGRDVACSYLEVNKTQHNSSYAPKLPKNITDIADEWTTNIGNINASFSVIDQSNKLVVKYEDLTTNTISILEEVCTFIGLEYDPQMLEFYKENKNHTLEPKEFNSWKSKNLKKIDSNSVGKYKSILSEKQKEDFNSIASEQLKSFGYTC